jgi:hypothetical protein
MTFCVLGENCSVFDRAAKTPGISRFNPLCEGCRNRAKRELNQLRYDYVDLSQLIPKKDGQTEAKIARPKPESSPTIDVAVYTLRSDIAWQVTGAEVRLRVHLGDRSLPGDPRREGYSLDASIRYLEPRVQDLARLPPLEDWGGPEYLVLFGELHRRSRRVCGLDPRTVSVPGFCPSCSVPSLRRHDDDPERIWCARCQGQLSREDYFAAQRMQFAPVTPSAEPR